MSSLVEDDLQRQTQEQALMQEPEKWPFYGKRVRRQPVIYGRGGGVLEVWARILYLTRVK